MWELDCEEGWAPKNWCFWSVVLEKTLESPLDCKEIHLVHSEGDQPWDFFGRNDAKAETPVWPPHAKSWLIGKDFDAGRDWGQEKKGMTTGWYHWLDERKSEWTPGVGDGQGGLACCDSWGRKVSDTTEQLKWTELRESLTSLQVEFYYQMSSGQIWFFNEFWNYFYFSSFGGLRIARKRWSAYLCQHHKASSKFLEKGEWLFWKNKGWLIEEHNIWTQSNIKDG